jgi:hypothetical protein
VVLGNGNIPTCFVEFIALVYKPDIDVFGTGDDDVSFVLLVREPKLL